MRRQRWWKPSWVYMVMLLWMGSVTAQECVQGDECCTLCCATEATADSSCCIQDESDKSAKGRSKYSTGIAFRLVITNVTELSVAGLAPGGPGDKAGLVVGDQIVTINGQSVSDFASDSLSEILRSPKAIKLGIQRDASSLEVTITPVLDEDGKVRRDMVQAMDSAKGGALKVGQPAPEIAAEDTDGLPFKLSDYRGKVVVLDFWGFW